MAKSTRRLPTSAHTRHLVIRVDLVGAKPPIWRRLELDEHLTLAHVHFILQTVFDWHDSHLHEFTLGHGSRKPERRFAPPMFELDDPFGDPPEDTSRTKLGEVLRNPGDRIDYTYDFGDDWTHTLALEKVVERTDDDPPARCLAGRRAAPPEDSGGLWQYEYMMEVGLDPQHPEYEEAQEWMEWAYGDERPDPAAFNVKAMDQQLLTLFKRA